MPYRILSLDGGGTFCTVQALALSKIFPGLSGHEILAHFELVAGTSGGSFVAAALAENHSADRILQLFHTQADRERFFHPKPLWRRVAEALGLKTLARLDAGSKHALIAEITGTAGQLELHELAVYGKTVALPDFLIVGYDYQYDKAKLFRSNWQSAGANFPRRPVRLHLRDAVHASTHAPLRWFGGVAKPLHGDHYGYWDGAMTGFNNPTLLAVAEALANGVPREEIRVLSIGTACTQLLGADTVCDERLRVSVPVPGLKRDLLKAAQAIIAEPPDADSYLAHLSLCERVPAREGEVAGSPVVRLNPVVHPVHDGKHWGAPPGFDVETFDQLVKLDISATRDEEVALIDRLCENWVAGHSHNQSVRRRGDYFGLDKSTKRWDEALCCEVGDLRFADAVDRWRRESGPPRSAP